MTDLWETLQFYELPDISSVLGLLISIIGFVITIYNVSKAKSATSRAEAAVNDVRDQIKRADAFVDLSALIAILEEIKRLHRESAWSILPERYSAVRKLLIALRKTVPDLSDSQQSILQNSITNFADLERKLDQNKANPEKIKIDKINSILSDDIDRLSELLIDIRAPNIEIKND